MENCSFWLRQWRGRNQQAASSVLIPVVGYLVAADRLRAPLDALRVWLARENAVIMAVLLLVIGVVLVGKGIGSF